MDGALARAIGLILEGDRELISIAFTSIRLSLASTAIVMVLGTPLGILLSFSSFPGKRVVVAVLSGLMALPTVVVGLLVYTMLSRSGPLGWMGLLYRPVAIIVGQAFLAFPIAASLVHTGLERLDPRFGETLITLGAKRMDIFRATIREAQYIVLSAALAAFGRVIGEVGVSMLLGGNIRWYTRTMTTTIALETSKGEFTLALALGIVLILIALSINAALHGVVRHER